MKTYAVCSSPEELLLKLIAYYEREAKLVRAAIAITSIKRDCDRLEVKALGLELVAAELREIRLVRIDEATPKEGFFL